MQNNDTAVIVVTTFLRLNVEFDRPVYEIQMFSSIIFVFSVQQTMCCYDLTKSCKPCVRMRDVGVKET